MEKLRLEFLKANAAGGIARYFLCYTSSGENSKRRYEMRSCTALMLSEALCAFVMR